MGKWRHKFKVFLPLALHRGESHLRARDALPPQKGTHRMRDRMATKAGLQTVGENFFFFLPLIGIETQFLRGSARSLVTILTGLPRRSFIILTIVRVIKSNMKWVRHVACRPMEEMRNVYTVLVNIFEGKGSPGGPKRKRKDDRAI
jgi:hypothetical protein